MRLIIARPKSAAPPRSMRAGRGGGSDGTAAIAVTVLIASHVMSVWETPRVSTANQPIRAFSTRSGRVSAGAANGRLLRMVDSGSTARLILINRCRISTDQPRPHVVTWSDEVWHSTSVRVSGHGIIYPGESGCDRLRQFWHREYAQGEQDVRRVDVSSGPVPGVRAGERAAEVADLDSRQWRTATRADSPGQPLDQFVAEVVEEHRVIRHRRGVERLGGDLAEVGQDGAHHVQRQPGDRA